MQTRTTTTVVIAAGAVLAAVIVSRTPAQQQEEVGAALWAGQEQPGNLCCVYPEGCTTVQTTQDCAALGGIVPQGGGWCSEPGCDILQACCHDDGTCSVQSQLWCEGTWGGGTSDLSVPGVVDCDGVQACVLGACCGDGVCIERTFGECEASGGIWRGDGSVCDDFNNNGIPDTCESIPVTCRSDSNEDGIVDIIDFLTLLADWGPCT